MHSSTNVLGNYIMSFNTYYLEPIKHEGKVFTRVIDKHNELIISRKPMYLVRKSCLFLGTNYEATRSLSKRFFGNQHKLPIIITHDFGIPCIFIPTFSPNSEYNAWIGLHAIDNVHPCQEGTKIFLQNGEEVIVPTQYSAFSKQYMNGTMLHKHFMRERKRLMEESTF